MWLSNHDGLREFYAFFTHFGIISLLLLSLDTVGHDHRKIYRILFITIVNIVWLNNWPIFIISNSYWTLLFLFKCLQYFNNHYPAVILRLMEFRSIVIFSVKHMKIQYHKWQQFRISIDCCSIIWPQIERWFVSPQLAIHNSPLDSVRFFSDMLLDDFDLYVLWCCCIINILVY